MITEVSIMLPAYNEAEGLEVTVRPTADTLREITSTFDSIIAEDGSTDGRDRIAEKLAEKYLYIKHLHSDERLGRGRALNRAFKSLEGEILAYIDIDLATDMKHPSELIGKIRDGYDLATGSRMMHESDAVRSVKRGFASRGFNFLVRTFLKSRLYDHQCGFKAFKRSTLFDLLDQVKDEHWFWDTEILVRAQRSGYRVAEFPVRWRPGSATKVNLIRDVIGMGGAILRLWWEFVSDAGNKA
jgi:glycosyltransferase involved in cell wall biosynthesis